jgi:hypothetical protein
VTSDAEQTRVRNAKGPRSDIRLHAESVVKHGSRLAQLHRRELTIGLGGETPLLDCEIGMPVRVRLDIEEAGIAHMRSWAHVIA